MAAPTTKRTGLFKRVVAAPSRGPLNDKFVFSPFSVFNARDGEWQDRKRAWISLGIQSELGRGDSLLGYSDEASYGHGTNPYRTRKSEETASLKGGLTFGTTMHPYDDYGKRKNARLTGSVNGKVATFKGGTAKDYTEDKTSSIRLGIPKREDKASSYGAHLGNWMETKGGGARGEIRGVSIFDPVLCELLYSWFCPAGGMVLDAFAGGSVRGIVAGMLGRGYTGVDLSATQVAANIAQAKAICDGHTMPTWLCGDSAKTICKEGVPRADFLFTCPPYADLERYSDSPRDLSTMDYPQFIEAFRLITANSARRLRPNRFAAVVVGEVRDKQGYYRGFVPDTIRAYEDAGLRYYNEAILVTAVGSLPIRASAQFGPGRKFGKTHQNILIFVKGNFKEAAAACNGPESEGVA